MMSLDLFHALLLLVLLGVVTSSSVPSSFVPFSRAQTCFMEARQACGDDPTTASFLTCVSQLEERLWSSASCKEYYQDAEPCFHDIQQSPCSVMPRREVWSCLLSHSKKKTHTITWLSSACTASQFWRRHSHTKASSDLEHADSRFSRTMDATHFALRWPLLSTPCTGDTQRLCTHTLALGSEATVRCLTLKIHEIQNSHCSDIMRGVNSCRSEVERLCPKVKRAESAGPNAVSSSNSLSSLESVGECLYSNRWRVNKECRDSEVAQHAVAVMEKLSLSEVPLASRPDEATKMCFHKSCHDRHTGSQKALCTLKHKSTVVSDIVVDGGIPTSIHDCQQQVVDMGVCSRDIELHCTSYAGSVWECLYRVRQHLTKECRTTPTASRVLSTKSNRALILLTSSSIAGAGDLYGPYCIEDLREKCHHTIGIGHTAVVKCMTSSRAILSNSMCKDAIDSIATCREDVESYGDASPLTQSLALHWNVVSKACKGTPVGLVVKKNLHSEKFRNVRGVLSSICYDELHSVCAEGGGDSEDEQLTCLHEHIDTLSHDCRQRVQDIHICSSSDSSSLHQVIRQVREEMSPSALPDGCSDTALRFDVAKLSDANEGVASSTATSTLGNKKNPTSKNWMQHVVGMVWEKYDISVFGLGTIVGAVSVVLYNGVHERRRRSRSRANSVIEIKTLS
eukprot:PhF_6_TR582/c0_g1_i7/m.631